MALPPDPISALVTYLKTDTDLAALVGTDVFDREVPQAQRTDMPKAMLVVNPIGGSTDASFHRLGLIDVDLLAYGAVPYLAGQVARAAHQALKHMAQNEFSADNGSVQIKNAVKLAGPISLRDADTRWPIEMYTFRITASEITA